MSELVKVVVDVMGGDHAPVEPVKGAIKALERNASLMVYLAGKEDVIKAELKNYSYDEARVEIVPCTEVIETAEPPVEAIKVKKDSSIVKGMKLVKDGTCDAFVSAGSSGAILVGGQVLVGRLKGVERPPFAPILPTAKGPIILLDCGANVDARPSHLVQFARMGSIYMEHVMGIQSPRVSILNIGAEEEKGNGLVKETFPLLKECNDIHFTGSIEARDVVYGEADVVVSEAFAGNICLKTYEGTGSMLLGTIKAALKSSILSKLGALLILPALKKTMKKFDVKQYGGAPLLGLKGLVVKAHGNASHQEICNSVLQCVTFKEQHINEKFQAQILAARDQGV